VSDGVVCESDGVVCESDGQGVHQTARVRVRWPGCKSEGAKFESDWIVFLSQTAGCESEW
jgi:hypothetical protein